MTGKAAGRGAYIHDRRVCWEKALKGPLSQALKTEIMEEDRQRLSDFAVTLPESEAETDK
jgi:predicted RNA-binding protein YlxR (DUF448 family)